jgi:hypothetical protein
VSRPRSGLLGRCGGRGVLLAATAALALAGCAGPSADPGAAPPGPSLSPPPDGVAGSPPEAVDSSPAPSPVPTQVADPVRVEIPVIAVDTSLVPLSIDATGALAAPERFDVAGWHREGPEPGEVGTAVIAGHVDSRSGPAVFFRLAELSVGDPVHVHRADGTVVTFAVTRLAQYRKDQLPSAEVYGPTGGIELRLVTCGGEFDRSRRSYRDNIVVFASQPPPPD